MKKRFSEEQIIGFLREADAGLPIKELCRKHGFSEASYYLWRSKFGGMSVPDAKRLKELETENTRLKKLLAEQMLENEVIKDVLRKKTVGAPARRALVRQMIDKGLSERCALRVVGMSASAYRYQAQPDRNVVLRRRIVELAQRHKRYGVGMIHLKLRQEGGEPVNYKRVERLYREERLQVRRRKRKKVPVVGPVVWMLLYDGLYYVWHRCQHRYALLWSVHRLHHSDRSMSATTYLRQNVLETVTLRRMESSYVSGQ